MKARSALGLDEVRSTLISMERHVDAKLTMEWVLPVPEKARGETDS